MRCVLVLVLALVLANAVDVKPASKEKADRMKAEAVKNLDLNRFSGLWYEIGSSGLIQKAFTKDCRCTAILFSLMDNNNFNMLAKCMNGSSGEVITARAKAVPFDGSKASFSLVSAAENASAAGGVGALNLKKSNTDMRRDDEQHDSSRFRRDRDVDSNSNRNRNLKDDEEEGAVAMDAKTPDYIILAVDEKQKDYGWAVIAAPKLDSVWILSRKPFLPHRIYTKLVSLIEQKGFTGTHIRKTAQRGCPMLAVRKMKELAKRGGIEDALVYKKLKKEGKFVPVGIDKDSNSNINNDNKKNLLKTKANAGFINSDTKRDNIHSDSNFSYEQDGIDDQKEGCGWCGDSEGVDAETDGACEGVNEGSGCGYYEC